MSRLSIDTRLCILCRGSRNLCGYAFCPIVATTIARLRIHKVSNKKEFFGSSPPSVFIGRHGYPDVYAGPTAPPQRGDTRIYDLPEEWSRLSLDQILGYRLSMVRGKKRVNVAQPLEDKFVLQLHELVLSSRPADIEVYFSKPLKPSLLLDEHVPPLGPSGHLAELRIYPASSDHRLEKAYYDHDLLSTHAVIMLYKNGVPVTTIQKLFSVGGLGVANKRKLVPTRWSITAVDDIVSRYLVELVKTNDTIDKYMVFHLEKEKNLFLALLAPMPWSFEWIEAWFPGSTWNLFGREISVEGDYEGYKGRTTYASIGGCYYAARLATAEYLNRIRRQATAVLYREIYPGFTLPVGVWFVRESLREMFRSKPMIFESLDDALSYMASKAKLGFRGIYESSVLVRKLLRQRRIVEWSW